MTARVMEANGHTKECNEARDAYIQAKISYEETYPGFCRKCSGWGLQQSGGDLVDYGSTQVHLPTYDEPCSCWEDGICPRCGHKLPEEQIESQVQEGEASCQECGWGYHYDEHGVLQPNESGQGLPEPPECDCWFNETVSIQDDVPVDWLEEYIRDTKSGKDQTS